MSEHKEIFKNIEKKIGFKPGILQQLDPDFLTSYNRCATKEEIMQRSSEIIRIKGV